MNAQKEAEYIAEIVMLKSELDKEKALTYDGIWASNSELIDLAGRCLTQISKNEQCNIEFTAYNTGTMSNPFTYRVSGIAMKGIG